MPWVSLGSNYPPGRRRSAAAVEELAKAYNDVFRGNPDKAQQEMVITDLANQSGFYKVSVPGEDTSLHFETGKRFLFGRIFQFLNMSQMEWDELHVAVRQEAMIDSVEGNIT